MISEWSKRKDKLENNFCNIILLYCLKWTKKLAELTLLRYNDDYIYTKFQKKLASIVNWSGEKRENEFDKFVNWSIKKFNINNEELRRIFINIIMLSIQIILNEELTNKKCSQLNFSPQLLDIKDFFYLCIKNVTKYYYLNPEKIYDTKNDTGISNDIIKKQLTNFIPFKNIFDKIQNDKSKNNKSEYTTSNNSEEKSYNKFIKNKEDDKTILSNIDNEDDDILSYVESLSFSERELILNKYNNDIESDNDANVKHITLPKSYNYKNRLNNYKTNGAKIIKNINDPDEKFFSDSD